MGGPVGLPTSSLGTTFEFFQSEPVASRTPGSGEILKSDRITTVEGMDAGGGARCDSVYIGTNDGMVHRVRVAEEGGALGYSVEGSFAAMEMERPGGIREAFRIRHVERVCVVGSSAGASATTSETLPKPSTSTLKSSSAANSAKSSRKAVFDPRNPSTAGRFDAGGRLGLGPPVQHPSAIGRRLYAVLEDTIRGRQVEAADELVVVVGHSRNNIVVRVWDVLAGLSGGNVLAPSLVSHKSVFKELKLLESDIESVAVATSEWPKVLVAAGTASGAIHVYCCADIGIEGAGGEFFLLRTVNVLQDKRGQAAGEGGSKANRVHHVSFVRGSGPGSGVWGASENGDVVGFRTKSGDIVVLDKVNGPVKRGCVSQDEHGVLSLVTRDGIFCYRMEEGRTVAISLQGGEKQAAFATGDGYLVIVGDEGGQTGQRAAVVPIGPMRRVRFQVLDLGRKILGLSTTLSHGPILVTHVRSSTGPRPSSGSQSGRALHLYVFDGTGKVHRMSEVPFQTQVAELCNAKMFTQALGSCEKERERRRLLAVDIEDCTATAARVHLLFGDHLHHQGEYEAAVDEYINTIGFVGTSHVIQTFLQDSGDIGQLRRYLTELIDRDVATGDHISLLMQVHVDANESRQIDELVNQLCLRRGKLAASLDVAVAVDVLRRAGFVQHALDIAVSYGRDDKYVSILMDCRHAYDQVLEYLKTRPRAFAAAQLLQHGAVLIKNAARATTLLVMDLCVAPEPGSSDLYVADPSSFAPLYVNETNGPKTHDFQRLCEQVILSSKDANTIPRTSNSGIYHSLLDAYLREDQEYDSNGAQSAGDAVLDLLRRGWPPGHEPSYDPDIALTRCAIHGHLQGVAFVHVRLRRYRDAVLTLADARDWPLIIDLCVKHGTLSDGGDPSIWHVALKAMVVGAAAESANDDRAAFVHMHLGSLLAAIGEAGAMAPLSVLDELAKNPGLPFSAAKNYFMDTLHNDVACINASSADIALLTKKIEATEESLEQLEARPATFKATRDSSTGSNLHVPAIHFMCGHSFNACDLDRHLEVAVIPTEPPSTTTMTTVGAVPDCPMCAEDHERVRVLLRNSKVTSRARDAFFRRLQAADDGFLEIGQSRPLI